MVRTHWLYLQAVLRHKWFVLQECWRLGRLHPGFKWALVRRGLLHDLSKFWPSEWWAYARYFYGSEGGTPQDYLDDFDRAWLHHQHRNPHHWQHHVLREDEGATKVLEMSWLDRFEMVCDWRGAGRAYGNANTVGWYAENRDKMKLGPETRQWVENELGYTRSPLMFKVPA